MAKSIIIILYTGDDWKSRQPYYDHRKATAYEHFYTEAVEYGFEVRRASVRWFNGKAFTKSWGFVDGQWKKIRGHVVPSIVMDKSTFQYEEIGRIMRINEVFMTINPWELDLLATDKLLTASAFSGMTMPTFLVRRRSDLDRAAELIDTDELIIKPRLGLGGEGIQIVQRNEFDSVEFDGLTIAQPMMDSSGGVPGLFKGVHDFRVICTGDTPVMSYIRIPPEGERLANISLGATVQMVPVDEIPDAVHPLLERVFHRLSVFPRKIFSADFLFHDGKPYLIEINTKPIMYLADHKNEEIAMHRAYLEYFKSALVD